MAETRKKFIDDISLTLTKMFCNQKSGNLSESFLDDVKKYLELKADPNAVLKLSDDKKVTYPAREAARIPSSELTSLLIKHGAHPYIASDKSAIVTAAKSGNWDNVLQYREKIMALKTNPNSANILGWALLHAAKDSSDKAYQVAEMLIEAGANVKYERRIYYVSKKPSGEKKEIYGKCRILRAGYYDESILNSEDDSICLCTPLHLAMYTGNTRLISLLVSHGAKYDGPGHSPVYAAELNNDHKTLLAYYEAMNVYLIAQEKQAALTK